ncbi:hypothetical protein [Hyphomicrobium sp.]|uniref:hypothetical protein n=1 Tax=Hyphomicrobium sp. TaxID=82 RepID=UPI001DADADEA|nr:hypothetical protein [Hyphomicrobium sp.]MBY0558902.1 hypothetical protein [Hyphomicrobium sp.]
MRKVVFGFIAVSSTLIATSALAEPAFTTRAPGAQSMVQKADYYRWHRWHRGPRFYGAPGWGYGYGYGGCYGVRHLCADRWGWGGPGFRRCMWRHGC